jgi:hypothetical protein
MQSQLRDLWPFCPILRGPVQHSAQLLCCNAVVEQYELHRMALSSVRANPRLVQIVSKEDRDRAKKWIGRSWPMICKLRCPNCREFFQYPLGVARSRRGADSAYPALASQLSDSAQDIVEEVTDQRITSDFAVVVLDGQFGISQETVSSGVGGLNKYVQPYCNEAFRRTTRMHFRPGRGTPVVKSRLTSNLWDSLSSCHQMLSNLHGSAGLW